MPCSELSPKPELRIRGHACSSIHGGILALFKGGIPPPGISVRGVWVIPRFLTFPGSAVVNPRPQTPRFQPQTIPLEAPPWKCLALVGRAAQGLGCYLLGSLVDRRGQHFYFYWHPATSVSRRTNPTVPARWIRYMLNDIQRMRGGRLVCIREAQLHLVSSRLLFSDVAMGL